QQLRRCRQMPAEALLEAGENRACRAHRELLARDLEDERAEGVEPGELVDPRARAEIGMRVDQAREHGIGVPKVLARGGIDDSRGVHAFRRRSVSTITMTSATVSSRAQSRWSSTARATHVTGCAPACTTRSSPARCASSLVPPIASTTG